MPDGLAKVVIVGAGFGGIEEAKSLRRAPVEVTVIDRQNHHCFQPLLYQVATAALSPADVAWPIRHILRKQKNATVLMAEVRAVDTSKRLVQIDSMSIPYDYLVLATGATHSYFGHDEWAEVAPGLKAHRGRDPHPAAHPHLRDRRRRPYRSRDGRRNFRGRAPEPGDGFPPHRSSRGAHRPARSRAAYHADDAGEPIGLRPAHAGQEGSRGRDLVARGVRRCPLR